MWEIRQGDALEILKTLPDQLVQCVVTSPPYWGLRRYLSEDAVCIKKDLTGAELEFVLSEMKKAGLL